MAAAIVNSTLKKIGKIADRNLEALDVTMAQLEKRLLTEIATMTATQAVDTAIARAQIEQIMTDAGIYERVGTLLGPEYQEILDTAYSQYKRMYPAAFQQFSGDSLARLQNLQQLDFTSMGSVTSDLADKLTRAIVSFQYGGLNRAALLEAISSEVNTSLAHLRTQFDTGVSGYYQEIGNAIADENGWEKFEPSGPLDNLTRPFCRDIMEKGGTYTKEEILAMDNDQGLSVFQYFGGYNCRHQWIAVPG